MNTKTNMWCKSLAVLALTCALANTALGQAVQILWNKPADITYGTRLSATQLNATAVDINGNDVTNTGEITYFWTAPEVIADDQGGNANRLAGHVALGGSGFKLSDSVDKDPNTNGTQLFDWLFLDAGNNQTLTAVFTSGNSAALTKEVNINVAKAPLSAVPATLSRNFGEENFTGYETARLPRYPSGRFMYLLHRNGADLVNNPVNNTVIDAKGNDANGDPVANIEFDLSGADRQLAKDDDANSPVLARDGTNLKIPVTAAASANHFSMTGQPITFSGFVRGENYQSLATNASSVASPTQVNNPRTLVSTLLDLSVQDGDGNDIFRSAPVGTTGTISFTTSPVFKNYTVNTGANGTLTVQRAEIEFIAKNFTDDNGAEGDIIDLNNDGQADNPLTDNDGDKKHRRKTYGNGISARLTDPHDNTKEILNLDVIRVGDFALNNNFRLGEAFIERVVNATAPGLAVDANVGSSDIFLFVDTSDLAGDTAFLNNYEIKLTSGSVNVIAREIDIAARDAAKRYGAGNPSVGFQVENPAPHQVKAGEVAIIPANSNHNGNRGDIYNSGQLKDGFFQITPSVSTSAGITTNVGGHTITISDGAAANHTIKDKINGTLTINRADLVLEVGNFSSVRTQNLATISVTPRGLLPFDTLSGILTNNPQFLLYPTANSGNGTHVSEANVKAAAANTVFFIEISNKASVRAANYNVFFNDGKGSFDGVSDGTGAASDGIAQVDGKEFAGFDNVPGNPIWLSGNNDIGRYTINDRGVIISWGQPGAKTFGNLLAGGLNATFINPDTGLPVSDAANGAGVQMIEGTHFDVEYKTNEGGVILKKTGVDLGRGVGNERYVLLKAGAAHKINVNFIVTNPPAGIAFGSATLQRAITINSRTVKVKPANKEITFGNNIPNNNTFTYTIEDGPGGHYDIGLKLDGTAIAAGVAVPPAGTQNSASTLFTSREIGDADVAFTTPATNTSDAAEYTLNVSGLKSVTGSNVVFNNLVGKFTIKKAPTTLTFDGDLAAITYGTPIGDAQLFAQGPPNVPGSVSYNHSAGAILAAGGQQIKAKFIPTSPNFDNSAEIVKNLTVNKKDLTVQAENASKVFGDDNPTFQATGESLAGLVPTDAGLITLTFQTAANNKSPVVDGGYPIEPVLSDPNNKLNNYNLTIGGATLTITKRGITLTPANRSMETETNPVPFLNDFITGGGQVNANLNGDTLPSHRVSISNLASFHAIKNAKKSTNDAAGFIRLAQLFPGLNFSTTATVNSPNGQSFPIKIAAVGATGALINGAKVDGNYTFSLVDGTLSVTDKKATITWPDVTITYGQAIASGGVKRADKDKDARTQSVNLFDATATPEGGSFTYRIKGQGDLIDGIIFPANNEIKLEAVYTPPASSPDFGETVKEMKLKVAKRPLNITILDQTNSYGSIDQNFQAVYGEVRKAGENDGDYNGRQAKSPNRLVNGDTPENLDQQLVLFSNATATSGAGTYFIAVAQTAEDANYDIRAAFGSQILRDGITRDPNNQNVILANVGNNINGIGATTSFVGDTGEQHSFLPGTGTPSTPVNFSEVLAAGVRTTTINDGTAADNGPLEFHAGKLTINKAPLTITADDLIKDQGAANPPFSATAAPDQLKNGDTLETLLKTQLIFVSGVNDSSPVGSFPISVTGASADNYIITHRPGTFSVQPPEAVVLWSPNPSAIVYGAGLTGDQLNASHVVAGSLDYSANPEGTVLGAGVQTLSATFTPDDLTLNRVSTVTTSLQVNPAPLTITANAINRGFQEPNPAFTVGFDGLVNGDTPAVLSAPVTFTTDGVDGANAGVYPLVPAGAAAANYDISFVSSNITIGKATAQITLGDLAQVADGSAKVASVTTVPEGVGVNVTYNGNSAAPVEAGTYEVRVLANDPNYQGFALGTLTLSGSGAVAIENLVQVFDGTGKTATVTTVPVGLGRTTTYNGSADAPVNAGTYEVRVVIDDPVFSGFGVAILTIEPATAEITFNLDSLSQPVNGITGASVDTVPAGLNAEIFYGDTTTLPTEIGSTLIRGVINEPNWVGSVTSTFRVTNATQTVTTFALPEFTMAGSPLNVGLVATASSGLPVTFAVSSGAASVSGNLLTVTQPGDIVVVASQAGDDFWAPAEASFTVTVGGQGVALAAPSLSVAGVSAAGIELAISGAAGAAVSVMSTDTLPGGTFSSVGSVTLDGSGNGSITVPASGDAGYFKATNQ